MATCSCLSQKTYQEKPNRNTLDERKRENVTNSLDLDYKDTQKLK